MQKLKVGIRFFSKTASMPLRFVMLQSSRECWRMTGEDDRGDEKDVVTDWLRDRLVSCLVVCLTRLFI